MSTVDELHDKAMTIADEAISAARRFNKHAALSLNRLALKYEREAAMMVVDMADAEPTRSVLLRSAATLALDCHEYREAERLAAIALAGDPPDEIVDELRDVLEQVYSALALQQINGTADPPYGLTSAVERAKSALKKLPEGHCAIARANGWEGQIRAPSHEAVIPLDAILSIRATPTKVGGVRPSVRFKSRLESDFTLSVTEEQARAIGAFLYKEVDIVAKVSRDSDGAIVRGRLDSFEPVNYGDPRPAWRDWCKSVGGEDMPLRTLR